MGRKTWDSIPKDKRPLKNRLNVVLTSNVDQLKATLTEDKVNMDDVRVVSDLDQELSALTSDQGINEIFVIGGSSLYNMCMGPDAKYKDHCKLIVATRINKKFDCDVFVPKLED